LQTTWDKIAQDFTDAAPLLKNRSQYSNDYIGRATKGAALAMLGKTYLYQNRFAEAYPLFKQVIESGEYGLLGEDGTKYTVTRTAQDALIPVQMVGFKYRYQPEANNSIESIFDVQHSKDNTTDWPEPMQGSLVARHYGPRNVFIHATTDPKDQIQSFRLNFWSFIIPTDYFLQTAFPNVGCNPPELDPRYKLEVYGPTDSIPYWYATTAMQKAWPDSVLNDAWSTWPTTGYLTWTYFVDPVYWRNLPTLGNLPYNTRYFHFNDLLLMGAEAAVQTNHNADALTWINRVRTRARNSGTTGYPLDYTGTINIEQVYAERRVELAFEGQEFFTIVRTGRAQKILKEDAMKYPTLTNPNTGAHAPEQWGDNFQIGKSEIFPIPLLEIALNDNLLTQNPGY
jgi:hypothetical protein